MRSNSAILFSKTSVAGAPEFAIAANYQQALHFLAQTQTRAKHTMENTQREKTLKP
jgi:hypothetical protein